MFLDQGKSNGPTLRSGYSTVRKALIFWGRIILESEAPQAVQKGRMGNNLTIADVGTEKHKRLQLKGVRYTRVPKWMLPKTNNFLRKS